MPLFTPTQFAGEAYRAAMISDWDCVKYWADASTIRGLADGQAVGTSDWRDRSKQNWGGLTTATSLSYLKDGGRRQPAVLGTTSPVAASSLSFSQAQPLYVFMVFKCIADMNAIRALFNGPGGTTYQASLWTGFQGSASTGTFAGGELFTQYADGSFDGGLRTCLSSGTGWQLAVCKFNGASSWMRTNGSVQRNANPGTTGFTAGVAFFSGTNMAIADFMVVDGSAANAYQLAEIEDHLMKKHRLKRRSLLLFHGDSNTLGLGTTDAVPPGVAFRTISPIALDGGTEKWATGGTALSGAGVDIPGQPSLSIAGNVTASWDYYAGNYIDEIHVLMGGLNDIGFFGRTEAQTKAAIQAYGTARFSANASAKVIAVTIAACGTLDAGMNTAVANINSYIRSSIVTDGYATDVVDVANDSRFQTPSDATYYANDGIHFVQAGHWALRDLMLPVIRRNIASPF